MKIIIFSMYIIFFTVLVFLFKADAVKEKLIDNHPHVDNKKLMYDINALFIDSPEEDLFLYSRLIASIGETGIESLGEYDFTLLKKNVEKVLEPYLNSTNLFPESYFDITSLNFKDDEWTNFIRGTLVYIEYLNSIGKLNKANEILEKDFYFTQQRVLSSKIMIEYISAILNYNTLFNHTESNKKSILLEKYPLPEVSIFFQKLNFEKEYQLNIYKKRFSLALKEINLEDTLQYSQKKIAKYREIYLEKVNQYLEYYDELAIVIKSESSERINSFYEKIEKEKNDFSEKYEKRLKIDEEKYIFLIRFPMNYSDIYNLHKKLINYEKGIR